MNRSPLLWYRDLLQAGEILAGQALRIADHFRKRTGGYDLPAAHARSRPEVDDVVRGAHRLLVVFDHDDGIAQVAQALETAQQPFVIARVQADAWLVEDVEHADQAAADLACQADPLGLPAGQRRRRALECQIVEADVEEKTKPAADLHGEGLRLRAFDFISEEAVVLRLWLVTAEKVEKPALIVLTAVDEPGWKEWLEEIGPEFKSVLFQNQAAAADEARVTKLSKLLEAQKWAFATLAPRGIGPTAWAEAGSATDIHIRRRFALLGQTLDGQRVWDVRRALAVLRDLPESKSVPLWLQGKNQMAGVVLYASFFEPDVARVDLWHPPASHREGPIFLNVRRILDMPQAVALAFPKQVRIYVKEEAEASAWNWPMQLQKELGQESLKIRKVSQ